MFRLCSQLASPAQPSPAQPLSKLIPPAASTFLLLRQHNLTSSSRLRHARISTRPKGTVPQLATSTILLFTTHPSQQPTRLAVPAARSPFRVSPPSPSPRVLQRRLLLDTGLLVCHLLLNRSSLPFRRQPAPRTSSSQAFFGPFSRCQLRSPSAQGVVQLSRSSQELRLPYCLSRRPLPLAATAPQLPSRNLTTTHHGAPRRQYQPSPPPLTVSLRPRPCPFPISSTTPPTPQKPPCSSPPSPSPSPVSALVPARCPGASSLHLHLPSAPLYRLSRARYIKHPALQTRPVPAFVPTQPLHNSTYTHPSSTPACSLAGPPTYGAPLRESLIQLLLLDANSQDLLRTTAAAAAAAAETVTRRRPRLQHKCGCCCCCRLLPSEHSASCHTPPAPSPPLALLFGSCSSSFCLGLGLACCWPAAPGSHPLPLAPTSPPSHPPPTA
ncbi:hypothetical protein G7046_g9905 [Stylonectria norvegica]|nr:hypothetical protein G7046_g9905 [Stylonectria norvegica]